MLCNECKKNQATVHFKGFINNQVIELHLCESCAKTKGAELSLNGTSWNFGMFDLPSAWKTPLSSLPELIAELVDFEHAKGLPPKLRCANCKLSYDDFKAKGRFGCAKCFESFSPYLGNLLKRIHGDQTHAGKTYKSASLKTHSTQIKQKTDESIEQLRNELADAIRKEEFERAAQIRDRIKQLQKN